MLAVSVSLAGQAQEQRATETPVYRSPNHVCVTRDGLRAYVVNQTADSVSVLDVPGRKVLLEIPVSSSPTHASLSRDETELFVTSRYGYVIDVIGLGERRVVRTVPTAYEPYGLTVSSDGTRIFVANSISNTVSIVDAASGNRLYEVPVGRDPRYIAETPGGTRLVVGNGLSRNVSIVDPASRRVVETRALGRASLLRQVLCSHDGRWVFVAHVVAHDEMMTLQLERGWINSNGFSVLDLDKPGHYVTLLLDRLLTGAANPWGLALSSDGRRLYVSLAGVHEVAIVDLEKALRLVEETGPDDVKALSENVEIVEKRGIALRVDAGGIGPRGLAVNEAAGEVLVANYFSDSVSVLDAVSGEVRAVIPLGEPQEMTLWRKGEMLANDARICFQQWYSCASCHQEDATMDALNWDLMNDGTGNRKNAKSLHDAYDTPPTMWRGVRADMEAAVQGGQRFLGFIPKPGNHEAFVAYFSAPRRAPNPYANQDPEILDRGEMVCYEARCHECHPPPTYTDGRKHDLDMLGDNDLKSRFDTPSLRECYRTGPYLHDGRADTLLGLFTKHNPNDLHGLTSKLTELERSDLLAYLMSL